MKPREADLKSKRNLLTTVLAKKLSLAGRPFVQPKIKRKN